MSAEIVLHGKDELIALTVEEYSTYYNLITTAVETDRLADFVLAAEFLGDKERLPDTCCAPETLETNA